MRHERDGHAAGPFRRVAKGDRLLLQPHGFEGLMMIGEDSDSPDLAVDKVVDVRLRRRHWNAARASVGAGLDGGQYLIGADGLQVLDVDVKVGGRFACDIAYPFRPRSVLPSASTAAACS